MKAYSVYRDKVLPLIVLKQRPMLHFRIGSDANATIFVVASDSMREVVRSNTTNKGEDYMYFSDADVFYNLNAKEKEPPWSIVKPDGEKEAELRREKREPILVYWELAAMEGSFVSANYVNVSLLKDAQFVRNNLPFWQFFGIMIDDSQIHLTIRAENMPEINGILTVARDEIKGLQPQVQFKTAEVVVSLDEEIKVQI